MSLAIKNREIKKILKATYPEVKFSVTARWSYHSNISWVDGPNKKQVKETTKDYSDLWFSRDISSEISEITISYVKSYYSEITDDYEIQDKANSIENKYYISSETYSIDWLKQEADVELVQKKKEFEEYLVQKELDDAKYKRYADRQKTARMKFDSYDIEVLDIEDEDTIVIKKFANLNKNNTLIQYEDEVNKGDYYSSNCVVKRTVKFNDYYTWTYFKNNLLDNYSFCDKFGGSKLLENDERIDDYEEFDFFSKGDLMNYWKANSYSIVIEVSYKNEKIYVNPEGFSYARYVGI